MLVNRSQILQHGYVRKAVDDALIGVIDTATREDG